jgi:hypothetical protein
MEIYMHLGIPVMDLDQLIRRALQDQFIEIQPPATVWGNIQRHLVYRKHRIPESLTRGLQTDTTSTKTRRSDQG